MCSPVGLPSLCAQYMFTHFREDGEMNPKCQLTICIINGGTKGYFKTLVDLVYQRFLSKLLQ